MTHRRTFTSMLSVAIALLILVLLPACDRMNFTEPEAAAPRVLELLTADRQVVGRYTFRDFSAVLTHPEEEEEEEEPCVPSFTDPCDDVPVEPGCPVKSYQPPNELIGCTYHQGVLLHNAMFEVTAAKRGSAFSFTANVQSTGANQFSQLIHVQIRFYTAGGVPVGTPIISTERATMSGRVTVPRFTLPTGTVVVEAVTFTQPAGTDVATWLAGFWLPSFVIVP